MGLILSAFAILLFNCFAENNLSGIITHLVFTRLIQYVQGLHGHSLVVVVKLCDQQLHAPATEELHACTQQHAEVLGSIQPARLHSETRSIVWSGVVRTFNCQRGLRLLRRCGGWRKMRWSGVFRKRKKGKFGNRWFSLFYACKCGSVIRGCWPLCMKEKKKLPHYY